MEHKPAKKGKGHPAKEVAPTEESDEKKMFFENLKSQRRGGQKAFTKEDMELFRASDDPSQDLPLPYPLNNDFEAQKQYILDRYNKKPPRDGIIPKDRKLVITEYSLDHWLAQTFHLDLDSIPPVKPTNIPKPVYEQLKKYIRYGNINYEAQQQKNLKRISVSRREDGQSRGGGSTSDCRNRQQRESSSQIGGSSKPSKYTYIIYPKTMKVTPFVDQLEQHEDKRHKLQQEGEMDDIRLGEDLATLKNEDLSQSKHSTKAKSPIRGTPLIARNANRSRNANNNSRTALQNTQTQHKIQRLANFKEYQRPSRSIRNRIYSDTISFLNPQEIEEAAQNYDKYLSNMKTLQLQKQSSTSDIPIYPQKQQQEVKKDLEQGKNLNFNYRRTSNLLEKNAPVQETTKVMYKRTTQGFHTQQPSRLDQRGQIQEIASHQLSKLVLQQNKPIIGNTPSTNIGQTAEGTYSSPPQSPLNDKMISPRNSLFNRTGPVRVQNHLFKFKLTTIKSKLKALRDKDDDAVKKLDDSQKLGHIVKRTLFNTQQSSSSYKQISSERQSPIRRESGGDPFGETAFKFTQHLFPPHKSNQYKLLKTLETTNITEILEDKNLKLTQEEKAVLSQRNHEKIANIILIHLEDEIEEIKLTAPAHDNVSINMVEITMDFNELQKRINDMNNPDFWLQKAIQKQKIGTIVAIEGAIDYYKQGLRINTQSEKLLYNIGCSYEKIGRYENAIRWFNHVLEVAPKHADSQYGLALCNFKLTRYQEALPSIQMAIKNWNEKCLIQYDHMKYFRALCYKKNNDKKLCQSDYEDLRPTFIKNLSQSMVKYVFGLLLLPLQEDRKFITSFFDNFNELLIFYQNKTPQIANDNKLFISQFCLINKQQSHPWRFDFGKYKHFIYYFLSKKSFFKRLPKLQAFSPELEEALVSKYFQNELVLIPYGYVGVVLIGTLFVLSHAEEDVMTPRLLFKCVEGSIIGHEDSDQGATCRSETWILAYEKSEVIFIKRDGFQKLWDYQRMNTQKQIILSSIQKNLFFNFMTQQLKYYLVYEKLTEKVFLPGQTVVLQSKRSSMNAAYKTFFETRVSRLRIEIENKKTSHEMTTGKKQSIIESFMGVVRDVDANKKKKQKTQNPQIMVQAHKDEEGLAKTTLNTNRDSQHEHNAPHDSNRGGEQLMFETISEANMPQCADQDEEFLGAPYCQGVYIVQQGSINLIYNNEIWYTLKNGESFGESLILKQPSYEYFGNLVAGNSGAKCYLFTYDVLRIIPPQILIDIVENGGFMRKKEGLVHVLTQKFDIDASELLKY